MDLYIGLMSGTSMDGIDAALVNVDNHHLLHGLTRPYSEHVKNKLALFLESPSLTAASFCELHTLIGQEFAYAAMQLLSETDYKASDIKAIGSHGQTVAHNTQAPIPYTLQLGCAHTISSLTQCTVVADFRTRDLINKGQGAPFAPLYHHALFGHFSEPLAVVNVGGIANVSLIYPESAPRGFDVGPGNCLLDAWIGMHQGVSYDNDGRWAKHGQVISFLLEQMLKDPMVQMAAPKSMGKEYFSLPWLSQFEVQDYAPKDIQATLVAFTAHCIAKELQGIQKVWICGGGVHNHYFMQVLQDLLPHSLVASTAQEKISPDYIEAMLFAWLAKKTMNYEALNLQAITGSVGLEILGAIFPYQKN